jgi:alpha-D-ribose 1-methylphosphonate 5-triphosphate synthase subunit PhnH
MSAATGIPTGIPAPGFADATREAQIVFRVVLDALAHPTRPYPLDGVADAPAELGAGLGAVALTVLDDECALWLDDRRMLDADVTAWLAFHTGVRLVADPADADFLVAAPGSLPPLADLATGTDEAPHRSATVLLDLRGCAGAIRYRAEGPGIDGHVDVAAPWASDDFLTQWRRNGELFPRGVDVLLIGEDTVAGLPRTTRLTVIDPTVLDHTVEA